MRHRPRVESPRSSPPGQSSNVGQQHRTGILRTVSARGPRQRRHPRPPIARRFDDFDDGD